MPPPPMKETLRREMRSRLAAMNDEEVAIKSALLLNRLQSDEWLPANTTVALFGGIKGEPDLLPLIPWLLQRQCTPVFFGFQDGLLIPQRVERASQLEKGIFGVWIPHAEAPPVRCEKLDVILTPGLAFGHDGMRLGRGRGHYDRLLGMSEMRARCIGVCWEFQHVETVPTEPHDVPMHAVVTEA